MTSTTTPGPIFRMSPERRIAVAMPFVGKEVVVTHSWRRSPDSDRELKGRVVSVANVASGGAADVIVLCFPFDKMDLAIPLSQVRSIEEYGWSK